MRISDWSSDVCSSDLAMSDVDELYPHVEPADGSTSTSAGGPAGNRTYVCPSSDATTCTGSVRPSETTQVRESAELRTADGGTTDTARSEERRVGKESVRTGRSGGSAYH